MLLRDWFCRVWPYLGRRQADADLREELRLHVELERARLLAAGVPDEEAGRTARRVLGNPTLIRERTRDVWGWRWLDDLGQDVRHALRGLRRNVAFTATVVCVLAAGIGANSAMFGIVYGMLIRPLPYPDADAIVRVGEADRGEPQSGAALTNTTLPPLEAEAESFEQLAVYRTRSFDWDGPDGRTALSGAWISPSLFPLLRARPRLGRLFTEADARAGGERVALLSYGAWTRRFGSSPDVVGTVMALDGAPHTVVGVLAEGFYFPRPDAEVWTPWVMPSIMLPGPGGRPPAVVLAFDALGRLRPGVSPERAATEVRTILQRIDNEFVRRIRRSDDDAPGAPPVVDARVIPLQETMVGEYRPALLALTAAVALVLLIACSNVAGLLLARGVTRRRELALRAALGAGRGRVVRQLLTESVVLGLGGGLVGLAAAAAVLRAVPALVPVYVARLQEAGVDGVVLAFTLGLSVAVGLAFGAAPAFQWSRSDLVGTLSEGSLQATGGFRLLRSNRTRATLAAGQAALAIVLLVGAGLLLRTFLGLVAIDRGYDPTDVVTARTRNPDRGAPGRPFHRGAARGSGGDGAPSRRGRGRPVVRPAARGQPHWDGDARRQPSGAERPQRVAAVVDSRGQPGLLRRDADATPRRAPVHPPRRGGRPAGRRGQRDPRARGVRRHSRRRAAGADRPRHRPGVPRGHRRRSRHPVLGPDGVRVTARGVPVGVPTELGRGVLPRSAHLRPDRRRPVQDCPPPPRGGRRRAPARDPRGRDDDGRAPVRDGSPSRASTPSSPASSRPSPRSSPRPASTGC